MNTMKRKLVIKLLLLSVTLAQENNFFSLSILSDISFSSKDSSFNSNGLEFVAMGNLRPNAHVMAYFHSPINGDPPTVEEVYVVFMAAQMKLGYFRPDVGILNKTHRHTFNFISSPNAMNYMFGPHSWASLGIKINQELPTPWKSNIGMNILQNGVGEGMNMQDHSHGLSPTYVDSVDGFSSLITLKNQFNLYGDKILFVGLNYIDGRGKEFYGGDFKFINRINQFSSWFVQSEYFIGNISSLHHGISYHPEETLSAGYFMLGKQFNKKYHLGLLADHWSYKLKATQGTSIGLYGDYVPDEDNLVFRFKILKEKQTDNDGIHGIIEMSWSLGSHKPKRY